MICLNSGTYAGFTLSNLSKSSTVTVQPAPGANVTISGGLELNVDSHLHFTGVGGTMKIQGGDIDPSGSAPDCSSNLTLDHITYSSGMNVYARCTGMNILIDHDTFDNLGTNTWEGRLNVVDGGSNVPATASVGVTISNSHFSGGCSDGIQVVGTPGVQIGPGNEFTNIQQNGCDPVHADPVQCVTAPGLLLTGNWFHDNGDGSGGLMCGNGEQRITVTNNVFACSCQYPYSIFARGAQNWTIAHNTFAGGGTVDFTFQSVSAAGNLVRDNVFTAGGGISVDDNYGSNDHNLNAGTRRGAGDARGTPVFVGGRKPTTYSGYRLANGSPGKGAGAGGGDMGILGDR